MPLTILRASRSRQIYVCASCVEVDAELVRRCSDGNDALPQGLERILGYPYCAGAPLLMRVRPVVCGIQRVSHACVAMVRAKPLSILPDLMSAHTNEAHQGETHERV